MKDEVISLSKFLSRYAFIKGKELNKIKHKEVKFLFTFLKRATFDEIKKDKSLLYMGKVVLVDDGDRVIPYYVPELTYEENTYNELYREEETYEIDDNVYDYSSLSEYELKCLLKKNNSSYRNQREARKELERRGISLKKHIKELRK